MTISTTLGEIAVIPIAETEWPIPGNAALIPTTGTPVNGAHLLVGDGPGVRWATTSDPTGLRLGCLAVETGSTAHLMHPERATIDIGPGIYEIRLDTATALADTAELAAENAALQSEVERLRAFRAAVLPSRLLSELHAIRVELGGALTDDQRDQPDGRAWVRLAALITTLEG